MLAVSREKAGKIQSFKRNNLGGKLNYCVGLQSNPEIAVLFFQFVLVPLMYLDRMRPRFTVDFSGVANLNSQKKSPVSHLYALVCKICKISFVHHQTS